MTVGGPRNFMTVLLPSPPPLTHFETDDLSLRGAKFTCDESVSTEMGVVVEKCLDCSSSILLSLASLLTSFQISMSESSEELSSSLGLPSSS